MAFSKEILYILMVCGSAIHIVVSEEARVSLKLYYESDCPDCTEFIEEQLGPLYHRDGEGITFWKFQVSKTVLFK